MTAATASQTIGPYWHLLEDPAWAELTRFGAEGEPIVLTGAITDGDGAPVTDACVELWQASPAPSAVWSGFGRAATDRAGCYRFITLAPGDLAPYCTLTLFARGLLTHLHTRAYFAGAPLNEADPLLSSLSPDRRATLMAQPANASGGMPVWRFDIRLQGEAETVFLAV